MKFGFENEDLMGKRVTEIPYRKLVELGAATPYEILVLSVSHNDIKQFVSANTWVRDFDFMENEEFQARFIASLIAMDKAIEKGYSKRILSFHSRVAHAENAEKAIRSLMNPTPHISTLGRVWRKSQKEHPNLRRIFSSFNKFEFTGTCKGGEATTNKKKLQFLAESAYAYLTNARVLTEGISVNEIDTVVFFDPKTSASDVAQAFSRAIRLLKGKELARIIVPVIYDDEGNTDTPQFQHLVDIIDFIGEQDSILLEEIRFGLQPNRVRRNSSRIINTDELEIEGVDVEEFYSELDLTMYSRYKSKNGYWTEERLIEYVATRKTRNELLDEESALRALEACDYALWKKLAPHIPLPNKGISEKECAQVTQDYTGTYEQFRKDYPEIISRFTSLAGLKSNGYTKGSELITKYCSHMKRSRINWRTITSEEVINTWLSKCDTKKDVSKLKYINALGMKIKKYTHLKEAFDYYNELPSTPTGLKLGQRRGGGWGKNE